MSHYIVAKVLNKKYAVIPGRCPVGTIVEMDEAAYLIDNDKNIFLKMTNKKWYDYTEWEDLWEFLFRECEEVDHGHNSIVQYATVKNGFCGTNIYIEIANDDSMFRMWVRGEGDFEFL